MSSTDPRLIGVVTPLNLRATTTQAKLGILKTYNTYKISRKGHKRMTITIMRLNHITALVWLGRIW